LKGNFKIFYLFLFLLAHQHAFAQDIHFSQVFNSPLTLSPAETGNFDGDWRVVANFRDQWSSLGVPYRTISASYDRQLYIKKRHISVGIFALNDKSGNIALKNNQVFLSGAYYRVINNHQLSGGLQIGYVMKQIDFDTQTTPDDFDPNTGVFIPGFGPSSIANDKLGYVDINLGLGWKKKIRLFEPQVGLAFHHINHPRESFNDENSRYAMRTTLHASVKTLLKQNIFVKPELIVNSLRGSKDFIMGGEAGFAIPGNQFNIREIQGGFYVRNGLTKTVDAIIFMFGAQVSNLQFQISYDINVSPLNQFTNKRGAFEISIIYKSLSTIIKTFTIPCERI